MKKLHISGRYLAAQNDQPFFYLGDTAWEIFHRLSREEIEYYMSERSRQGFTAIQAVALSEMDGIATPNIYGRYPFLCINGDYSQCLPDEEAGYNYWNHVDFAIETAAKYGLFITLLPTWGDKFNIEMGKGPEIFNEDNAYRYAKWLSNRYKSTWNIIWMLGGDRRINQKHRKIIDAMARGIKDTGDTHLITFHPYGGSDSTQCMNDAAYLDFHTAQTGHGTEQSYTPHEVMKAMANTTDKPYLDSEPRYEDHPACFRSDFGYLWNEDDVRQNAYWSILEGTCGHTYGNHCVWYMNRTRQEYWPYLWNEALLHNGAEQMMYIKNLRLSRDYFSFKPDRNLVVEEKTIMGYLAAGCGENYAFIYSPLGLPFLVNIDVLKAKNIKSSWFNPRTGETEVFAVIPGKGTARFVPPSQGKGNDWVLILDVLEKE